MIIHPEEMKLDWNWIFDFWSLLYLSFWSSFFVERLVFVLSFMILDGHGFWWHWNWERRSSRHQSSTICKKVRAYLLSSSCSVCKLCFLLAWVSLFPKVWVFLFCIPSLTWCSIISYQVEALEKAIKQNTVVFLETGSGKTLIAIMLLRSYAYLFRKPSPCFSVFLVPQVVLVSQVWFYLSSTITIGVYSGWPLLYMHILSTWE